jgi:hypothetical protein
VTVKDQNVELVRGEAVEIICPITRQVDGSFPNLDGATCVYRAVLFESGDTLIEKPATVDVAETIVSVILEGEETAALEGNFYHEFRITDVAGRPFVVSRGALISRATPA